MTNDMRQHALPFMQIRGGSSKGIYLLASDLPTDSVQRDRVLLDIMGHGERQIDGMGGADPLTSKAAIVSPSKSADADVDFLFVQVIVGQARVDTTPNCGNILAGVGAFAVEQGLVEAQSEETKIRVKMLNTNKYCELVIATPNGQVEYAGDQAIDGVPGTASPVLCNYPDLAGAVTGGLFPTGNLIDEIEGIAVTCVDNGMPVVLLRAADFSITGYESPAELNANRPLTEKIEAIRLAVAPKMNIHDAKNKAIPKMCLVSKSTAQGLINTRTFIPYRCHAAIGVLGAVSVATACIARGTVADDLISAMPSSGQILSIEHPSGEFSVKLVFNADTAIPTVQQASVVRTARLISKGWVYLPSP